MNLVDLESKIVIQNGGELIINGQLDFTGSGHFRFELGNVFTLNTNLILTGAGRTVPIIKIAAGATITVNNPVDLRVLNGSIVRDAGFQHSLRHIWLRNGATFRADNVVFDDLTGGIDQSTFIEVDEPFDTDNNPDDVDYQFVNCKFQNTRPNKIGRAHV